MLKRRDILASIEERVESLLKEKIEAIGYELYDVEYSKEGKNYFLRIFIDKTEGIDLNDCEKVNNEIDEILDEADYIKEQYFLEVSSPGAERPLKKEADYMRAVDKYVNVSLYQQLNGHKVYEGYLRKVTADELTLEYMDKTRQKEVIIPRKQVAKARLAIKF